MDTHVLPHINAALNASTALILVAARHAAKQRKRQRHSRLAWGGVLLSAVFLVSYIVYHLESGVQIRFQGSGLPRVLYLLLLGSHSLLAAFVPFGVVAALILALREKIDSHRKVVRILWPVWMYVSVTGVLVYAVLFRQY